MTESRRYPARFPPPFADAWGDDSYGLWAEFVLNNPEGSAVRQRLRWIEPGTFPMGSPDEETRGLARNDDEKPWFEAEHPRHPVTLNRGYWLADTPCTQALWQAMMGGNPSRFQSPDRPVEQASWDHVQGFLRRLQVHLPGVRAELPTEAEWEYACRAGTDSALYSGPIEILGERNAPALDPIAWYGGNSGVGFELDNGHDSGNWPEKQYPDSPSGTHPVGRKQPNPWGLYDMLGNVWEWCGDGFRNYTPEPVEDPVGIVDEERPRRAIRGGSWGNLAGWVRAAYRGRREPGSAVNRLGFRLSLRSIEPGPVPQGDRQVWQAKPEPGATHAQGHGAPPRFEAIDLGELEASVPVSGRRTMAVGLNNNGQVVGHSNGLPFLWVWGERTMTDMSVYGFSEVVSLNDNGVILGYTRASEDGPTKRVPIVWDGNSTEVLSVPQWEDSDVDAINIGGVIVGAARVRQTEYRVPVRWVAGILEDLSISGGQFGIALDVNSDGEIVGYVSGGGASDAFRWSGGSQYKLTSPGNEMSFAISINEDGEIVGYVRTQNISADRPVLWERGGEFLELGTLEGLAGGQALDINDSSQIVGNASAGVDPVTTVAVLWHNRIPYDLNSLVGNQLAMTLTIAVAINNRGDIIANSADGRAYLLRPV